MFYLDSFEFVIPTLINELKQLANEYNAAKYNGP